MSRTSFLSRAATDTPSQLMAQAEQLLRATASHGGRDMELARSRLKLQLDQLRASRPGLRQRLAHQCEAAGSAARRCARQHPAACVLVAGATGAVLAYGLLAGTGRVRS